MGLMAATSIVSHLYFVFMKTFLLQNGDWSCTDYKAIHGPGFPVPGERSLHSLTGTNTDLCGTLLSIYLGTV